MRIGFITQLLWSRYGPFWQRLVEDAGADVVLPEPSRVLAALGDPRLQGIPGAAFRLAAAQALALESVDLVVAPALNPDTELGRGGGQDPWIADFPGALATLSGLAPVLGVPALPDASQETLVVETLHSLMRDAVRVRRLWERHRPALRPQRFAEPRWTLRPSELATVGVIGQPWLVRDELSRAVAGEGEHLVPQHRIDPRVLRDEGTRFDARMVATDSEVIGAARLFNRRGSVARLRMIVDRSSGSDAWLVTQVERLVHKPLTVHYLQDLLPAETLVDTLLTTP